MYFKRKIGVNWKFFKDFFLIMWWSWNTNIIPGFSNFCGDQRSIEPKIQLVEVRLFRSFHLNSQ